MLSIDSSAAGRSRIVVNRSERFVCAIATLVSASACTPWAFVCRICSSPLSSRSLSATLRLERLLVESSE